MSSPYSCRGHLERESDIEGAPVSRLAVGVDAPAVPLDDLFDKCEPESRASYGSISLRTTKPS